ncbi:hypothetical protein JM84_0960 [Dokdonia sp. Hel_I_63]|uniref:hypothetical protein n=1 Tax=unclassified Dokdonia TaxID=2615033 RepID=UPI00020A74CE|nr:MULTISPECIES: hypothetical protein [unclassified Dokdonia]AEE18694.1 hypothetical protein Krodi_0710 [Dokdonia sp. 4H-3-7-5]TVZ22077.1 hypothetical protein JM84_0960 [Dokdonia sp. Hel_I_63]
MESSKYLEDIASIKTMMSKSSRFMSLSGLSGILAGVYALIAAVVAHYLIQGHIQLFASSREDFLNLILRIFATAELAGNLIILFLVTLLLAIGTGIILTYKKAAKNKESIWDSSSKRLIANFAIPLVTGGVFSIVLIQYGIIGLIAPATLIFYGLALVNASKYTLGDIKYLGLANIIIGLIATQFIGYGLYFWALGFGVFHIIYGAIMYNKYDRQKDEK